MVDDLEGKPPAYRIVTIPGLNHRIAVDNRIPGTDEDLIRALEILRTEGGNVDNRIFNTEPNNHVSGTGQDLPRAIEVLRTEGTDAASPAND